MSTTTTTKPSSTSGGSISKEDKGLSLLRRNLSKTKLQTTLRDPIMFKYYTEFLYNDSNFSQADIASCWYDIESFKQKASNPSAAQAEGFDMATEAANVFLRYFDESSTQKMSVSLSHKLELQDRLRQPNVYMFDQIQMNLANTLANDSFPKYLESEEYKKGKEESQLAVYTPTKSPGPTRRASPATTPTPSTPPMVRPVEREPAPPSPASPSVGRMKLNLRASTGSVGGGLVRRVSAQRLETAPRQLPPAPTPAPVPAPAPAPAPAAEPEQPKPAEPKKSVPQNPTGKLITQVFHYGISQEKAEPHALMQQHIQHKISEQAFTYCYVHIEAEVLGWTIFPFIESTTGEDLINYVADLIHAELATEKRSSNYQIFLRNSESSRACDPTRTLSWSGVTPKCEVDVKNITETSKPSYNGYVWHSSDAQKKYETEKTQLRSMIGDPMRGLDILNMFENQHRINQSDLETCFLIIHDLQQSVHLLSQKLASVQSDNSDLKHRNLSLENQLDVLKWVMKQDDKPKIQDVETAEIAVQTDDEDKKSDSDETPESPTKPLMPKTEAIPIERRVTVATGVPPFSSSSSPLLARPRGLSSGTPPPVPQSAKPRLIPRNRTSTRLVSVPSQSSIREQSQDTPIVRNIHEEFFDAIKNGDAQSANILLSNDDVYINYHDETGFSALHWACRVGNVAIVTMLLEKENIDVNCVDSGGWTPLHYASQAGFTEVVELLLAQPRIEYKKKNSSKKKPSDLAANKEISTIFKEHKHRIKKDHEKQLSKKKTQLALLRKLPSYRSAKKGMIRSVEELLAQPILKKSGLSLYSDHKWKDRWVGLTRDCIIIDFPDIKIERGLLKRSSSDGAIARESMASFSSNPETAKKAQAESVRGSRQPTNDTIILLAEITRIFSKDDANPENLEAADFPPDDGCVFGLQTCYLRAHSKAEMAKWMLAVDGMKNMQSPGVLSSITRNALLGQVFAAEDKGKSGIVASTSGERWKLEIDGTLHSVSGVVPDLTIEYLWNGKTLVPKKDQFALISGVGVWNEWYISTGRTSTAVYSYLWNETEKEFQPAYSSNASRLIWEDSHNMLAGKKRKRPLNPPPEATRSLPPPPPDNNPKRTSSESKNGGSQRSSRGEEAESRGMVHSQSLPLSKSNPDDEEVVEQTLDSFYVIEGTFPRTVMMFLPLMRMSRELIAKYERMEKFLLGKDGIMLTEALCDSVSVNKADEITQCLVNIFERKGKTLALIQHYINYEVSQSDRSETLFRSNSISSKLVKFYLKLIGNNFLRLMFNPLIKKMSSMQFEIDPVKLASEVPKEVFESTLQKNIKNVKQIVKEFFDAILGNIDKCPKPILVICFEFGNAVKERFPHHYLTAIGGFLFLRYLCPAILQPNLFGIIDTSQQVTPNVKRGLILIAKILQNVSNGGVFKQEEYMLPFNEFIESNISVVDALFKKLADHCPNVNEIEPAKVNRDTILTSFATVFSTLQLNRRLVIKSLEATEKIELASELGMLLEESISDEMTPDETERKQSVSPPIQPPASTTPQTSTSQPSTKSRSNTLNLKSSAELVMARLPSFVSKISPIQSATNSPAPTMRGHSGSSASASKTPLSISPVNDNTQELTPLEELKKKIATLNGTKATKLVEKLLVEFEKQNLLKSINKLMISDDPNTFLVNLCRLDLEDPTKFQVRDKIQKYFSKDSNFATSVELETIESRLQALPKDTAIQLGDHIVDKITEDGTLRSLLETAYRIHHSKRFVFTFLLTLAVTHTDQINGMEIINNWIPQYKGTESETDNETLLDAVIRELKTRSENLSVLQKDASNNDDYETALLYQKQIDTIGREIDSIQNFFEQTRFPLVRKMTLRPFVPPTAAPVFSCTSCGKNLEGEGYVTLQGKCFCRKCGYIGKSQ